jgi:hypothetical protein
MPRVDISPNVTETSEVVRYEFALEHTDGSSLWTLFYEFARECAPLVPDTFDAALCAVIFKAMAHGFDIRLRGPATRTLLRNLHEFQLAWCSWMPKYHPIHVEADTVVDATPVRPARSIAAFSGGVDATFTLLRNSALANDTPYRVDTVLLVHGFEVPLANPGALHELVRRTECIRALSKTRLRIVKTNSRELVAQQWKYAYGAALAACLHLCSAEFSWALVGSTDPYSALVLPMGSNPVTDHLLSGDQLAIVHDGAAFSRTDKVAFLARFPEAMKSLKVCWEGRAGREEGRNCGTCEKCVRTQLNLLAAGVTNPPCFDAPFDIRRLPRLPIRNDWALIELQGIVAYARRNNVDGEWLRLLRKRLDRYTAKGGYGREVRFLLAKAGLLESARTLKKKLAVRTTQ